jgi:hypothetical protein
MSHLGPFMSMKGHTSAVLAGTAHPRPVRLDMNLTGRRVEAKEASGKNRDKVFLVVDVVRVKGRVDQVRERLVARLSPIHERDSKPKAAGGVRGGDHSRCAGR